MCFFHRWTDHRKCHGISRRMQASCAIKVLCYGATIPHVTVWEVRPRGDSVCRNFFRRCRTPYRHLTCAIVTFRKDQRKPNFAQGGIKVSILSTIVYIIQGSLFKNQIPIYWNLIGRSMTAPPPMLSPNTILLPTSHWAFIPARKNSGRVSKIFVFKFFFYFYKIEEVRNWVTLNCVSRGMAVLI